MAEQKPHAFNFFLQRTFIYGDAYLGGQVVEQPHIVVTGHPIHRYAGIGESGNGEAHIAAWHHILILVPIIQNVTQQIHFLCVGSDAVEETDHRKFFLAWIVKILGTQVQIAEEINHLLDVRN